MIKICLKEYISEKEYKEISELQDLCRKKDNTNLKIELNYKLRVSKNPEVGVINEFLYYMDERLVAYLGISSFGANLGELNGMTHPDFRRKGIFKKLLKLALDECALRNFDKILLLTDGKSQAGTEFIKSTSGSYDFSEYRMRKVGKILAEKLNIISLREAEGAFDRKEIARQNGIYFYGLSESDEGESFPEKDEDEAFTYMVELQGEIIGKIKAKDKGNYAFISGVGILPKFRNKGYGKAALCEVLHLLKSKNVCDIELDVECKNNNALNLYKSCGFEERSVMDYYKINCN